MPEYLYECLDCKDISLQKHNADLKNGDLPDDIYEAEVLYQTQHSVKATDEELLKACKCPRCGSSRRERSIYRCGVTGYIRGYGYLDRSGCRRDMNKYTLMNNDPYADYRTPGEVEHIKDNLDKGGRYNPKTQYFTPAASLENAVRDAVTKPDTPSTT